tara:strand:- start:72 stop:476 length:405 start_codon:yes stop_codon:yes gene_type:complete
MEKVRVYWNLHKDVWSVRSCKSGLVIDHKPHMTIKNGYFSVWESGQKRVREEGKKNVHAFAVGYIVKDKMYHYKHNNFNPIDWDRVKYDPYTDDYFMHKGEDHDKWNEIPRDWVGWIRLESLHHENGIAPRVYI